MTSLPVEVWTIVLSHVDCFASLKQSRMVCKSWFGIIMCEADQVARRAVQSLDINIRPSKWDSRYKQDARGGVWWNAGLRYQQLDKPATLADSKLVREDIMGVASLGKCIEMVAEFNRRARTPRSIIHQDQGVVIFSAQINPIGGAKRICYPMINFIDQTLQVHHTSVEGFPDFTEGSDQIVEYSPDGEEQRAWSCADLQTGSPLISYQYFDVEEDDSVLISYGTSASFHKYELRAARPDEQLWSINIGINRQRAGIATVLATNDYILIVERSLKIYRIRDKQLIVQCDVSSVSDFAPFQGGFAVSRTHLLAIDKVGFRIYSIPISRVICQQTADLSYWDLICSLGEVNPSLKFSEKRYGDRFVTVVCTEALCLIDLIDRTYKLYGFIHNQDYEFGFQTVRLAPRSSCYWMVDENGQVAFVSQKLLGDATRAYNSLNAVGPVPLSQLVTS